MAEAGVNLVTVGVFSWARLQPAPGELTAGWLDRVLDLLAEAGIWVDLATATASPPAVAGRGAPRDPAGHRGRPAARARRAAAATARARPRTGRPPSTSPGGWRGGTAEHPAVAMWHIGNEYGCHVPACYCEQLGRRPSGAGSQARYGELGRLNEAWGGAVWSQDYTSWDQVEPPRTAPTFANPAQQLDFARFSSDELLACYRAERAVLAAHSPARRSRPTSWGCSGRWTSSGGRPSSTWCPWTATPTRPTPRRTWPRPWPTT